MRPYKHLFNMIIWRLLTSFCGVVFAAQAHANQDERLLQAIRQPGVVILMRHAETYLGVGDPPGFRIDDCKTQRNLSPQGLAQAIRWGRWLEQHGLQPKRIRASQWCRCLDTAKAAFGVRATVIAWSALNSFFQGYGDRGAQITQARSAAAQLTDGFEVWVTHQVVISELTDIYLSMGEFLVVKAKPDGRFLVLGRGEPE